MNTLRRVVAVAGIVALAAVAAGCSGGGGGAGTAEEVGGGGSTGGGGGADQAARGAPEPAPAFRALDPAGGQAVGLSAAQLPRVGPSIIKTADVEVSVPQADLRASVQEAVQIAAGHGGFVASTSVDAEGARRGTVVLRVPAPRFERALAELEKLGRMRHENVSGVDVTQEFVDLQARLRNWQSQEAVLLRLMGRARSVTDTIRVQGELGRVQLEIERLRGRLDYLQDQTDLATISTTFVGAGPSPAHPTTLARAWREAVRGALQVISTVVVAAGYAAPLAVLAALIALGVRALRPRLSS